MSFYGNMDDAKKNANRASLQIDGMEPGSTSPVQSGSDGSFDLNLEGEKNFTDKRTRPREVGHQTSVRRELHPIPLKKGGVL
jgi:hypothetical protein